MSGVMGVMMVLVMMWMSIAWNVMVRRCWFDDDGRRCVVCRVSILRYSALCGVEVVEWWASPMLMTDEMLVEWVDIGVHGVTTWCVSMWMV